ncbi:MAG: hypothetical protein HY000_14105 [Planctomycetes bacterium]|nr:hypothetical protein [Planctomycetota bacterium]
MRIGRGLAGTDQWRGVLCAAAISVLGCTGGQPNPPGPASADSKSSAGDAGGYETVKRPDPIALNGPIFEGWTKPRVALVISGVQNGYIEPCGCAGLENQKGGLARRCSFLKQQRGAGWQLATLDVGGMIRRYGRQTEIKYEKSVDAYVKMGYDVLTFGADDLHLPADALISTLENVADAKGRFVAANLGLLAIDDSVAAGWTSKFKVIERGGKRIGVTAVMGEQYRGGITNQEVQFAPAAEAISTILPELKSQADYLVLLAHATQAETIALAQQFPDFDVVVTAEGGDEPPRQPRTIEGTKTLLIEVGHKGMFLSVLGLYDDPQQPWRYQRVPLDHRFPDAPEMKQVMADYQAQLRQVWEELGPSGLGLMPIMHPRGQETDDAALGQFAGAQSCKECHPTAFGIWSKTHHAQATETLTKLDPPRQFDPECLSCHSTGWNPQEYFPYESGFLSLEKTPLLSGNGCENCHGPGGGHITAEKGKDLVRRDQLRAMMRLTKATAEQQVCHKCHDSDNSPKFHYPGAFETYWPKVEHKGKK